MSDYTYLDCIRNAERSGDVFDSELDKLYYALADYIFDYASYDTSLSIRMGQRFFVTIDAILNHRQERLINSDFYEAYIMCLNLMQHNCKKIDWGTSIRFCWFNYGEEEFWSESHYKEMLKIYNKIKKLLEVKDEKN